MQLAVPVQAAASDGMILDEFIAVRSMGSSVVVSRGVVVVRRGKPHRRVSSRVSRGGCIMERLVKLLGSAVGSWIGWWLGGLVSLTVAFIVSTIGAGVGLYLAIRLQREYF